MEPATIVGLLADPARLKVVAALALGAASLEEVAEAAELPLPVGMEGGRPVHSRPA